MLQGSRVIHLAGRLNQISRDAGRSNRRRVVRQEAVAGVGQVSMKGWLLVGEPTRKAGGCLTCRDTHGILASERLYCGLHHCYSSKAMKGKRSVIAGHQSEDGYGTVRRLASVSPIAVGDLPPGQEKTLALDYQALEAVRWRP